MGLAWYSEALNAFGRAEIDWESDDIRVLLVDINDYGVAISGATNATPIVVTSNGHGINNGDIVAIVGVGGNTAANGVFIAANVTANTFELTAYKEPGVVDGTNVAGNGAYTSGGFFVNLSVAQNLDDVPGGARISTAALDNQTVSGRGKLDADNTTLTSVTGDPSECLVVYKHTGTESTSLLLLFMGEATSGLPVTPDGNNINITWNALGLATL